MARLGRLGSGSLVGVVGLLGAVPKIPEVFSSCELHFTDLSTRAASGGRASVRGVALDGGKELAKIWECAAQSYNFSYWLIEE